MSKKISVVGFGKLGCAFGLLCEKNGISVMAIDKNKSYLEKLHFKTFKTSEPYIEDMLKESRLIEFSSDIGMALNFSDIIFCFVATPSKDDNSYDHQYIEEVVFSMYEYNDNVKSLRGKTLVINCTTTPMYCASLSERLANIGVDVYYNPEFINQGNICDGLENADIVLIGQSDLTKETNSELLDVYYSIMKKEPNFKILDLTGAEIAKLGTNFFLSAKISIANVIHDLCMQMEVPESNIPQVLEAIGSDSRIGNKFFKAGYPASGVCLPRDVRALQYCIDSVSLGYADRLPEAIIDSNKKHLEAMALELINDRKEIYFDYISYKKGVPILTESAPLELCKILLDRGRNVVISDSEQVIEQVKPILEKYNNQITYQIF